MGVEDMDSKSEKQMAKMVDAVQPHCDEQIVAAMTCSHAGSMSATLASKLMGGAGAPAKSFNLPNPVFIAVGTNTVYAFSYKPRGFKFKIKKEVMRWPRDEVSVKVEETNMMCYFNLMMSSGESYPMEVSVLLGGRELVHLFLKALNR
jgi:hypothetical protein